MFNMLSVVKMKHSEEFLYGKQSIGHHSSIPTSLFYLQTPLSSIPTSLLYPQTPPDSTPGGPDIESDGPFSIASSIYQVGSPISQSSGLEAYANASPIKLPRLEEFDQGVNAIARQHGSTWSWTPPSPLPSLRRGSILPDALPSILASSSEPQGKNLRYTIEEQDFIIYAVYDMRLAWELIPSIFAKLFGYRSLRTVNALKSLVIRMNRRIPLWADNGYLVFENDDDVEPKQFNIADYEKSRNGQPMQPLGIALRYPERAITYSWVDEETKDKAGDWGYKRAWQLDQRREHQDQNPWKSKRRRLKSKRLL